jgi:hypothetical protein
MIEFDNARRRLVMAAGAGLVLAGANNQIVQAAESMTTAKRKSARSKT